MYKCLLEDENIRAYYILRLDPNNVLIYVEDVLKDSLDHGSLTVEEGLVWDWQRGLPMGITLTCPLKKLTNLCA